uniref:G-protein coupled receptors family 1 profile domain-containing protein n=1 Tax=Sus scrofa TaxID=9823 RepID=A0A8W4F8B9_PIG
MEPGNQTSVLEFLLLGLSQDSEQQPILFGLFLSMFVVTVFGNLLIILAISSDPHLHTPMYFFLSNLSLADICFTSTTIPKMLVNIQTQRKAISYAGCITQVYFFMVFGGMDTFLLTVMAYDRFVAICHPCTTPLSYSLIQSLLMLRLSFCSNWAIPHFHCELSQALMLLVTGFLGIVPFSGILCSYTRIVSSILRISSAHGKYKAFSTCVSHLSVVSLFYGTGLGVYLSSEPSSWRGMVALVMYTVVTPICEFILPCPLV